VEELDELLARGQALHHLAAQRLLLDPGKELLGHIVVDVGLQKVLPDLLQAVVHVPLAELAVAPKLLEGLAEFV